MRKTMLLLVALAIAIATAPLAGAAGDPSDRGPANAKTTEIQILGLNDFHGQLEVVPALASSGGRIGALVGGACTPPACYPAGGVEYLATHVENLRATNPNTLFVSAGDLIGATPLLSALFHDEPTIEAFNLMGLDYNGVGNHEFDEGVDELLRMQHGGCHPVDGCADGTPFEGASFDFLAANVKYKASGEPIFAPYKIHHFNGVKVGIIGMTLEGTPEIVTPAGISTVNFLDEAETANAAVAELRKQNVETIIVLLHEGGNVSTAGNGAGAAPAQTAVNSCVNPTGALPPIVAAMDDEIDIVVTGHTNWAVNCIIDGKVVTGAASQGRLITDIDFEVSRATKDVVGPISVNNHIVTQDVAKTPALTQLIAGYNVFAGPIAARVIGSTTAPISRTTNAAGESALGDVIADAQLANTLPAGAQLALMNPGGIRADITTTGPLTYGAAFAVQPFSNIVVTMSLTGAQIERVLEQQFRLNAQGLPANTILQVSNGFTYSWSLSAPIGSKVDPASIKLNGVTLGAATTYRVTVNSFLATGGDGFSVLNEGTNRTFGDDDLIALEEYFQANSPVAPGPQNRITRLPERRSGGVGLSAAPTRFPPGSVEAMKTSSFRDGVIAGLPLAVAPILFGAAFGVLAVDAGMGRAAPVVMSATTFAGSAQFAAASILDTGGGAAAAIVAAVLLNARYAPLSIAVSSIFPGSKRRRLVESQLIVDESWAIAGRGGRFEYGILVGVGALFWLLWVGGTALGTVVGDLLDPEAIGLDAAFPALFLALLVPYVRTRRSLAAALTAAAITFVLIPVAPAGIPIVAASLACLWGLRR